jgi:chromosomal replication initiator protein
MNSFWRFCLAHFEKQLPPQQFKTWIEPLRIDTVDGTVTLVAPNRFVLQWIRDKYLGDIERIAHAKLGVDVAVMLITA